MLERSKEIYGADIVYSSDDPSDEDKVEATYIDTIAIVTMIISNNLVIPVRFLFIHMIVYSILFSLYSTNL